MGSGGGPPTALLERGVELSAIRGALDDVRRRVGAVVAFVGPPGIGKTALLLAAHDEARRQGFQVLSASGSALELAFPFGVCRQLFEAVLASAGADERTRLLTGAASLAGRMLLADPSAEPPSTGADRDWSRPAAPGDFPLLHGLHWLAVNLADERPLLITVDDLQWADTDSIRFVFYLARRVAALPLTLLVTVRERSSAAADSLTALLSSFASTHVLHPAELGEAATAEVVRATLGAVAETAFIRVCRDASGGNPFYLHQLLRALAEQQVQPVASSIAGVRGVGPRAIARELIGRVRQLGPASVALVRSVAVLDGHSDVTVAGAVAGLPAADAAAAADLLDAAGVLVDVQCAPRLTHPIMQAAVYDDIAPLERARLHRRAAELLAERAAGPATVAAHLLHTTPGNDPWLLDRVRDAAHRALDQGALGSAIEYLRRGLQEAVGSDDRFHLSAALGQAMVMRGDVEGIEVLEDAVSLAGEPVQRAKVALQLAEALIFNGRAVASVGVLAQALESLRGASDCKRTIDHIEAMQAVIGITDLASRHRLSDTLGLLLHRVQERPGTVAGPVLAPMAAQLLFAGGRAEDVARLATAALANRELDRPDLGRSPLPYVVAFTLIATDQSAAAEAELDAVAERAAQEGAARTLAVVQTTRSLARLRRGNLRAALADAEDAMRLMADQPPSVVLPVAMAVAVLVHLERGEPGAARTVLDHPAGPSPDPTCVLTQPLVESRARLCAADGDDRGCLHALDRIQEWAREWGSRSGSWPVQWRSDLALTRLRLGDRDAAARLAAEDLDLARAFGAARPTGRALVVSGLCTAGAAGLDLLEQGVSVLARSEDRLEEARARIELGAAVRRQRRPAAARVPLRAGMAMARSCGATALARRAYDELRATGARPAMILDSGPDSLTASELRVARMAAGGMTNRAIAEQLFVTQKTIEVHLGHCYQKLGISSRTALPAVLGQDEAAAQRG